MFTTWFNTPAALVVLSLFSLSPTPKLFASDDAKTLRAYDQPVPNSAKFHTVTVTVLDDETTKPVADAQIIVINYVDLKERSFLTGASGRLRFEYPYVGTKPQLSVELRKDGYVPLRQGWVSENDPRKPVDALTIRLRRGTTMGGIVVYKNDQPVEDVMVVMTVSKYGPGKRPANPTGHEIYYEVPSRTGRDGRWRTDSVPPGAAEVNLQLIHPDFVSDGTTTLGIKGRTPSITALRELTDRQVLLKGVEISGRVLDHQGKPIAGAEVIDSTRGLTFLPFVRRAFSDAEGRFHFHLARGGDVTLTAQVHGSEPATLKVSAEPSAPPIEFRLALGRSLRGRIVDPQGKPIAGANIIIPSIGQHKEIFLRRWSDADGRFDWDSAPSEKIAYSIYAAGYLPRERVLLAPSNIEEVVVLQPAVDVTLQVVDAGTGEPIPQFTVELGRANPFNQTVNWVAGAVGAFNGDYHMSLEAGNARYRFKITADGYAPAQTRIIRGEEKEVRETIKLERK
jgi:hypothetical protein